jgi:branched-chain amino acid transport system substrate-binding protein
MTRDVRAGRRKLLTGAGALTLALALAACSSPGGDSDSSGGEAASGGGGLPDTIKIMDINGLTGPVAFAGSNAAKGTSLAVEQIEADGLLGDTTIEIDSKDAAADPQQAASFASQAIADPSYAAILGPSASAQSAAVSPIVQQAGIPTVYVQSGSDGVIVGDFTYRLTPPAASYYDIVGDYIDEQGIKTASILFNAGNPTLAQLGQETVPALLEDKNVETLGEAGVEVTAQDFTTSASQIAGDAPDAAFLLLTGPQYPVAIGQLKQAGFTGEIIGFSAMGAGNLTSAGQAAAGAVWPTNFTAEQTDESSVAFLEAYEEKYDGEVPNNYAAEAYDRMWFLARAIAEADSADRAAIKDGLAAIADEGFDGAQGHVTFEDGDARVPGVLVRWDGSKEVVVESGS